MRMALQGDPVFTKGDRRIGEETLQFLDTRPLRLGRFYGVCSEDRQISRLDHDIGVLGISRSCRWRRAAPSIGYLSKPLPASNA